MIFTLLIATILDNPNTIILDTINQLENKSKLPSKFILGVINSKLLSWYAYRFVFAKGIRTMHFDGPVTSKLPFPIIFNGNISNIIDKHVDTIIKYNKLICSKSLPQEKEVIQRQIDAVDKEIDRLIYELYGLTEEEIKIIESP